MLRNNKTKVHQEIYMQTVTIPPQTTVACQQATYKIGLKESIADENTQTHTCNH